jgi:hypothetical protein
MVKWRSVSVRQKNAPVADRRYNSLSFFRSPDSLGAAIAARELLHPASGVDELLFPGEKRMASSTDADSNIRAGGASVVSRAARTDDVGLLIIRMNIRLHGNKRAATLRAILGVRKR